MCQEQAGLVRACLVWLVIAASTFGPLVCASQGLDDSNPYLRGVSLRSLTQWVDGIRSPYTPDCGGCLCGFCKQENACLPGSYSLDNSTYCACCRPRGGVDPRAYTCGFVDCYEGTWGQPVTYPLPTTGFQPPCIGKWMKCNSCPTGTTSPRGSDSPYDCKSFSATQPTCYDLKNFTNPDVVPFPGMYFWPLNYTAMGLQKLTSGPCAGHGLPVQVCLGANYWTQPASLYQMWFIMDDGTKLAPYAVAGTNRGNTVIGFVPTSNSTCKWAQRNSLYYKDGPLFEISGYESCTSASNITYFGMRRLKFSRPPVPYCTPNLVVV